MNQQIVNVNIENFLRTGIFGAIEFGLTSDQILKLLGVPDFVFTHSKTRKPMGFEYGDVELYFVSAKDNRLCAICLDEFDVPKGSQLLSLDAWHLRATMQQVEVEAILTQADISFQLTQMPDPKMRGIITEGGVILGFVREPEGFSPPAGLYNIARELRAEMEAVAK